MLETFNNILSAIIRLLVRFVSLYDGCETVDSLPRTLQGSYANYSGFHVHC